MISKNTLPTIKIDLSDKNTQVGLNVAIFIFILVILITVVIRPNILAINDNMTRLKERQEAVDSLDIKIKQLNAAYENYSAISNQLDLISDAVPDGDHLRETLAILEKNASDVVMIDHEQLAITNINLADAPDVIPFSQHDVPLSGQEQRQDVQINVSVRGSYFAVHNFIQRIKSNRRNFQVKRLSIVAPENSRGSILDVMITLNHFYYGETYGAR